MRALLNRSFRQTDCITEFDVYASCRLHEVMNEPPLVVLIFSTSKLNRVDWPIIQSAKKPIPNCNVFTIVLVYVIFVQGMVDLMETRRANDIFPKPSPAPSEM